MSNDSLAHHGVKGMRWGIRRYQPYPKGSSSKGKFLGKVSPARKQTRYKEKASQLSDSQLKERTKRLNMEQNYNRMNESPAAKQGKKAFNAIIVTSGTVVASQYAQKWMQKGLDGLSRLNVKTPFD